RTISDPRDGGRGPRGYGGWRMVEWALGSRQLAARGRISACSPFALLLRIQLRTAYLLPPTRPSSHRRRPTYSGWRFRGWTPGGSHDRAVLRLGLGVCAAEGLLPHRGSAEQAAEAHRLDGGAGNEHQGTLFLEPLVQDVHRPQVQRGGVAVVAARGA